MNPKRNAGSRTISLRRMIWLTSSSLKKARASTSMRMWLVGAYMTERGTGTVSGRTGMTRTNGGVSQKISERRNGMVDPMAMKSKSKRTALPRTRWGPRTSRLSHQTTPTTSTSTTFCKDFSSCKPSRTSTRSTLTSMECRPEESRGPRARVAVQVGTEGCMTRRRSSERSAGPSTGA